VLQEDRLVNWKLVYTRQTQKDAKKLAAAGLKDKAVELLEILERDPHESPPPYEKLKGDLAGACSRRISVQHRLVYQILDKQKTVKIIRLWTHYE
jgi:Txe/YoeB family toxin of toxin-antitoxin system